MDIFAYFSGRLAGGSAGDVVESSTDYTEAYNLMTKEMPVENIEGGIIDYIGTLVGVSE